METIICYTTEDAVSDGILVEVSTINEKWSNGLFNMLTTNLLNKCGYIDNKGYNLPNIMDLLNQANNIVRTQSNKFKAFDSFFSGDIELPSGESQKIFIEQNETGNFTILLPEDH